MSIKSDAIQNLELAGFFDKDSDYEGMIGEAVKRLVECHCNEGHSGTSSAYCLAIFNKVISGKALTAKYWDIKSEELRKMIKGFAPDFLYIEKAIIETLGERPKEIENEQK